MSDISDRVPSPADRKVFFSCDYQSGTWDWGLGTRDPNPNTQPLAPNPSCAALGSDVDETLDTILVINWGSVSRSPRNFPDDD